MFWFKTSFAVLLFSAIVINAENSSNLKSSSRIGKYEPNWDSLDSRPLPQWYDDAKFGIFIHWGLYSVPAFGSEWFWNKWKSGQKPYVDFMESNYKPGFSYQDFAPDFNAKFFNPKEWVDLFQKSGAKYVVLTSKHHDGYTLWPSKHSFGWNSMDVGPHRDLVGELADAVRKNSNMTFGLYHSLLEWFNPMYLNDNCTNPESTREFVKNKVMPEMIELINLYKPEIMWSDGARHCPVSYWGSTEFIAWLFNDSPVSKTIVVNDRWGTKTNCRHGSFVSCKDRFNPGALQTKKWENAMTIDKISWGYRSEATLEDFYSAQEIITQLVSTVSCGGNLLLNVGPTKEGRISPIYEDRLLSLGKWLDINGEAIYKSKSWKYHNDTKTSNVWYTQNSENVFAIVLNYPEETNSIDLYSLKNCLSTDTKVSMLGYQGDIKFKIQESYVTFEFPPAIKSLKINPYAWTFKFSIIC